MANCHSLINLTIQVSALEIENFNFILNQGSTHEHLKPILLLLASRYSNRIKSPERMTSSCYGQQNLMDGVSLMTQSLDPSMLSQSISNKSSNDMSDMTNGGIVERCLEG